jgi:hypothetical protein
MTVESVRFASNAAYLKAIAGKNISNQIQKSGNDIPQPPDKANNSNTVQVSSDDLKNKTAGMLSQNEKEFFENLFPQSVAEIRQHFLYQQDGSQKNLNIGTIVDRKG